MIAIICNSQLATWQELLGFILFCFVLFWSTSEMWASCLRSGGIKDVGKHVQEVWESKKELFERQNHVVQQLPKATEAMGPSTKLIETNIATWAISSVHSRYFLPWILCVLWLDNLPSIHFKLHSMSFNIFPLIKALKIPLLPTSKWIANPNILFIFFFFFWGSLKKVDDVHYLFSKVWKKLWNRYVGYKQV